MNTLSTLPATLLLRRYLAAFVMGHKKRHAGNTRSANGYRLQMRQLGREILRRCELRQSKHEMMEAVVICTSHLSMQTRTQLDEPDSCYLPYLSWRHGWIFYVTEDVEQVPDDLAKVLLWAKQNGFEWVRFDSDANEVEDLPVYED